MARSCGSDPGSMTVRAGQDLALYLRELDRRNLPLLPARRLVSLDEALAEVVEED